MKVTVIQKDSWSSKGMELAVEPDIVCVELVFCVDNLRA